jgi:dienelactone hydrolase
LRENLLPPPWLAWRCCHHWQSNKKCRWITGLNEHVIMVPAGIDKLARLQTTVFRPNGPGPFPLLVINHGKELGQPHEQARDRFVYLARAFVKRGYAVLVPMRQGFADSTGRYMDFGCDMRANGYAHANDVLDTIEYARKLPWIDDSRIIVAGQSYGGMATLAMGTQHISGVRGLINFAGGLRDDRNNCDWRNQLVRAFADFGARNKVDSLWVYGDNDSLFAPDLVRRMYANFVGAGGTRNWWPSAASSAMRTAWWPAATAKKSGGARPSISCKKSACRPRPCTR